MAQNERLDGNSIKTEASRTISSMMLLGAIYGILAYASISLSLDTGRLAAFWIGNGLVIGMLLDKPRPCQISVLTCCFLANIMANAAIGDEPTIAVILASANLIEMLIGIYVLEQVVVRTQTFQTLKEFAKMAAIGICAPLVPGLLAADALAMLTPVTFAIAYTQWLTAHCLAIPIIGSMVLICRNAVANGYRIDKKEALDWIATLVPLAISIPIIFVQTTYPFLFLAAPVTIFAAFRTGRIGTAFVVATYAVTAAIAALYNLGPIALTNGGAREEAIALQVFIASNLLIGLPVAVVLAGRRKTKADLRESRDFANAILNGIGDVVFKIDANWRFTYLNDRWHTLTGHCSKDMLGDTPFGRLLDPDNTVFMSTKRAIENGRPLTDTHILPIRTADGRIIQVEINLEAQWDAAGKFIGAIGSGTDVTEKLARSHALKESETRFRKLAEASPVGIFTADPNGNITYFNQAWLKSFKLKAEDMLGDGWKKSLAHGSELEGDPAFAGFEKPGDIRRRIFHFKDGEGEDFWCETVNSAEFDASGKISGFVGVAIDITEQRRALEKFRASEELFQTLANMAPAGIFRTAADGDCTYVNQSWKNQTGLEDGEWEGTGWTKALHPEDAERVARVWVESVENQVAGEEEFRWKWEDGTIIWSHVVFGPELDTNGNMTGMIGVVTDITDNKLAQLDIAEREAQLALLADNATDTVLRLSLDGICLYASPSARQIFGVDPHSLVGNQLITGFHPDDVEIVKSKFRELATGKRDRVRISFRSEHILHPGQYQWLEANCGAVLDAETGKASQIIASLRNIDETKRLEAALLQSKERAEAARDAKSAFLANMSHEIRTPMNGVIGFTELALAGPLEDDQRQHLEMIADSGRAMLTLLNDLLDFAKIEAGQMTVASEPTDITHKIRGALRIMEPVAKEKGLTLEMRVADDVPQWVQTDAMRIRQIILNLVGNALKFTDTGGVVIDVSTTDDKSAIEVDVIDTGIGIPEEQIDIVFDKFTQADSSIARRFGGTGLGLPICSQLASLLGGALTAKSSVGIGSTFSLTIPIIESRTSAETSPARPKSTASQKVSQCKVLVAEDNYINQRLTLEMLKRAGFEAELAEDGAQAVSMIAERHGTPEAFDIVLMDMQMPNLDGLQATAKIRAAGITSDTLPIIAVTANAYQEDIDACIAAGMQAHLSKPIALDKLEAELSIWTRSKECGLAGIEVDPHLNALYANRKSDILRQVDSAIRAGKLDGATLEELTSNLHQLAGVAAMFGEEDIGAKSRAFEKKLNDAPADALEHLEKIREMLAA
ncbi:PAS domain S-box protein [Erythrobacter aureus]|uniref:Sensory/regulatory protein RpfC n=1 Tax=Erythrobacter aureus TaxID=2182384 RepID=A0A345YIF6_9SPHN|nr:PAS domain S-box protein [Erythrobacter aureus]AXK43708.1 PAS domain S-box protein [Erythrobacter aureus]